MSHGHPSLAVSGSSSSIGVAASKREQMVCSEAEDKMEELDSVGEAKGLGKQFWE